MGIIHRDIKSENILIDSRENIRIVDFGLSYLDPTGKPLRQEEMYAVEFQGTPPYMAPEVLRNKEVPPHRRKRYGMAVDWWALGCVLFELESQNHQVKCFWVWNAFLFHDTRCTWQVLFDTEQDVHTYVAWAQRPCQVEQTYAMFKGLDPTVVNLLEGVGLVFVTATSILSDVNF